MTKFEQQLQRLQEMSAQYKELQDISRQAAQQGIELASKNAKKQDAPYVQEAQILLANIDKLDPNQSLQKIQQLTNRVAKAYNK
ncbi:MAG: hypothetical protein HRU05_00565 [Oceanospirillaceae bacterium]|nr:hypothetical protein [Oceanospirillaceae bacterium]